MTTVNQKISPSLWYDRQAEEAANLYASAFKDSKIRNVTRAGQAGSETTGLSEGTVMSVEFEIKGLSFVAINGGPMFKFTPAISFLVACDTTDEVDSTWKILNEGGTPLMELGAYPFSQKYGWTQDRYGLSWQIMFMGDRKYRQAVTPTLMFVGEQWGRAEGAVNFYASVFHNSKVGDILRYNKGEEPDKEGTIRHAAFTLEKQEFAAMDSAHKHLFTFSEAVSLMIRCQTQAEVNYYWDKLTLNGGQESMCGWLKDKFGVSWQVVPTILGEMLGNPDKEKVARVTNAFLKMKKLDIEELKKAFKG
jgi:predicted 3-demethylubiquinone-9 3-methyltransferase (glyoxalase superfamily)